MSDPRPSMTRATGVPVAGNLNIMTAAGPRGPALLQDIWLIEKMAHFDREVIPERRMHAKGRGDDDHYEQPGNLFRMMTASQRQVLFENTARAALEAAAE